MTRSRQLKSVMAGVCLALLANAAQAEDASLNANEREAWQPYPSSTLLWQPYQVAEAQTGVAARADSAELDAVQIKPAQIEKDPFFTLNKTHKYLGLSTLLAAVATAVTSPDGCERNCNPNQPRPTNGTHANLGRVTAVLAGATVFTGVLAHWDDIHLENGMTDADNLHALLGLTGAALLVTAVNQSLSKDTGTASHAAQAEAGALMMAIGIKLVW